jgi:hypothetical protein
MQKFKQAWPDSLVVLVKNPCATEVNALVETILHGHHDATQLEDVDAYAVASRL